MGCKAVDKEDEVMIITTEGIIIRTEACGISEIGRNTSGVKLINIDTEKDVSVASIAKVKDWIKVEEEDNEENQSQPVTKNVKEMCIEINHFISRT